MENQKAKTLICRFIVPYFPVYSPRIDVSHYSDSLHVKAIDVGDVLTQAVLTGKVAKILVRTVLGSRTSVAMREYEQKKKDMPCSHANLTYITRIKHREGKNRVNRSKISL